MSLKNWATAYRNIGLAFEEEDSIDVGFKNSGLEMGVLKMSPEVDHIKQR